MSLSYGWEKLHAAVHSLCGQGEQSDRLVNAVSYSLLQITPENDLPGDVREEFSGFMRDMTSVEALGDEGKIRATVSSLDDMQVREKVEAVISFYDTICRHREP